MVALEVILSLLKDHGGKRFRSMGAPFVRWVKGDLCTQLMSHCTSSVMGLVSLSLRIFVALVAKFK
ncbi:unnamed protein product, partial [Discosporangium mesarthrocarpum]